MIKNSSDTHEIEQLHLACTVRQDVQVDQITQSSLVHVHVATEAWCAMQMLLLHCSPYKTLGYIGFRV